MNRRPMVLLVTMAACVVLAGCSFRGINSYTLPLNEGGGSDALTVTIYLENATNLVPNSEVKYHEVTIGSVRKIEFEQWRAKLTVGLEADAQVPADVHAKVAQKSLLGAQYLELSDPDPLAVDRAVDPAAQAETAASLAEPAAPLGPLADGAVIDTDRTGRYPETEEVLTAASLLLNGGGLPAVKTIATEVNAALSGRSDDVASLVSNVDTAASRLNGQVDSITAALEQMQALTSTINGQTEVLDTALATLPSGVDVLVEEEDALLTTLQALGRMQDATSTALGNNGEALGRILDNLVPVTEAVNQVEDPARLVESVTYPVPASKVQGATRSDYINLAVLIHVKADDIAQNFLGVSSLDGLLTSVISGTPVGSVVDTLDPLLDPIDGILPEGLADPLDGLLDLDGSQRPPNDPTAPVASGSETGLSQLLKSLAGGQ